MVIKIKHIYEDGIYEDKIDNLNKQRNTNKGKIITKTNKEELIKVR